MLEGIDIKNFRGIKNLSLEPLGRINLIAGKNGIGKTTLLEAFWIFSGPDLPDLAVRVNNFRGLHPPGPDTVFVDLFNEFEIDRSIEIVGKVKTGSKHRKLAISLEERSGSITRSSPSLNPSEPNLERSTNVQTEGQYQIVFDYTHDDSEEYISRGWWVEQVVIPAPMTPVPVEVTNAGVQQEVTRVPRRPQSVFMAAPYRDNLQADAQRFGNLQLQGRDGDILSVLRTIEPKLESITTILVKNTTVLHANIGMDRPIAARLLGEGFSRIFSAAVSMGSASGGMLLIDEIENGLHHTVLNDVFANLFEIAKKFEVQVVATTHSLECIKAAYEALGHMSETDFTFHRIDRIEDNIKAVYFERDQLETAIRYDMEVR